MPPAQASGDKKIKGGVLKRGVEEVRYQSEKIVDVFQLPISFTKHFHSVTLSLTHAARQAEK